MNWSRQSPRSVRCCFVTSFIWLDIIGSFISDALLSCKIRTSGTLIYMTPTLDIYTGLFSQQLPAWRPNQFFCYSMLDMLATCWRSASVLENLVHMENTFVMWDSVNVGHQTAVTTWAVKMKEKTSFCPNINRSGWNMSSRLIHCSEIFTWFCYCMQEVVLTFTLNHLNEQVWFCVGKRLHKCYIFKKMLY